MLGMHLDILIKLNRLLNFFGISGFILVYVTLCANSAVLCCPGFCLTLCSCTKQKQHLPKLHPSEFCSSALHCTGLCFPALHCAALHYKEINRTRVQSTISRPDKYLTSYVKHKLIQQSSLCWLYQALLILLALIYIVQTWTKTLCSQFLINTSSFILI